MCGKENVVMHNLYDHLTHSYLKYNDKHFSISEREREERKSVIISLYRALQDSASAFQNIINIPIIPVIRVKKIE